MDFIDQIKVLAAKIPKLSESIKTEEATKNALVLPLLNILGIMFLIPLKLFLNLQLIMAQKKAKRLITLLFRMVNQ